MNQRDKRFALNMLTKHKNVLVSKVTLCSLLNRKIVCLTVSDICIEPNLQPKQK